MFGILIDDFNMSEMWLVSTDLILTFDYEYTSFF